MTFSEFWPERNQYVGKETRLRAKVVYELECPPDDQSNCTATGYLTSRHKDVFLAHEEKEALLIHDGGEPVRCQTPTTLGLDCRGWQQHEEYVVRGVVHRDGSDYRIDVKEREHV